MMRKKGAAAARKLRREQERHVFMKMFSTEKKTLGMTQIKKFRVFGHTVVRREKSPDRYKVRVFDVNTFMRTTNGDVRSWYVFGLRILRTRRGREEGRRSPLRKVFTVERISKGRVQVKKYRVFGHTVVRREKSPERYKVRVFDVNTFMWTICGDRKSWYVFGLRVLRRRRAFREEEVRQAAAVHQMAASPAREEAVFPVWEQPLVSIIIPVFNQVGYTKKCLTSVLEHADVPYEVIVADDASTDDTRRLAEYARGVTLVRSAVNAGYIRNVNGASRLARGKYLYFLNNDTVVGEGWLSALVEVFEKHPDAGVVGSRVMHADGTLQECGVYTFADEFKTWISPDPEHGMYAYLKKADYVSGCSLMTRADLFRDIGGFDERYAPAYSDDPDYCFEAARRGHAVYVQPRSVIVHFGSLSYEKKCSALMIRNNRLLREKWAGFFAGRTVYAEEKMPFSGRMRPRTILVVDDHYPAFDRHAGARSVFSFLRIFLDMGLCVKFCALFAGEKEQPYHDMLCDMGVEVLCREDAEALVDHGPFLNYAFFSRPAVIAAFMTKALMARGVGVFYYGHDAHHLRMERERRLSGTPSEAEVQAMKELEMTAVSSVTAAWYPSEEEAAYFRSLVPGSEVRALTPYVYDPAALPEHESFEKSAGIIFVGSSHGPNLDGLRWFVAEVMPFVRRLVPGIVLHVVGSGDFSRAVPEKASWVRVHGALSEPELDALYARMKVAVAPLRFGAGVKGKVVDALAHGVPVAATTTGAQGLAGTPAVGVADEARALAGIVTGLCLDEERWKESQACCAPFVAEHFSRARAEEEFRRFMSTQPVPNELPGE